MLRKGFQKNVQDYLKRKRQQEAEGLEEPIVDPRKKKCIRVINKVNYVVRQGLLSPLETEAGLQAM